MVQLSEAFPSNYLKSSDLQGHEVPVVIAGAELEMLGNERKLILTFQGKKKSMVCNKTNAGRIAHLYGEDTDDWIGKEIILYSEMVEYQGRTVDGLRVKAPKRRPNGKPEFVTEERDGYTMSTTRRPERDDDLPEGFR